MASLESLPAELLRKIASSLCSEKHLSQLAKANRYFYQAVLPLIYRHVDLALRERDGSWNPKCELLLRSIRARPELANHINHVVLSMFGTYATKDEDKITVNVLAKNLLCALRNLRSLRLDAGGPAGCRLNLTGAVDGAFSMLERVELNSPDLDYEDVCAFLHQPNIRILRVRFLDYRTLRPDLIDTTISGTTSLSELHITAVHVPENILSEILRLPRKLHTLTIQIPGLRKPSYAFGRLNFAVPPVMESPLSPSKVTESIQPAQATLVSLKIFEDAHTRWRSHDGTRLNLASFTALQVLKIPSHLVFPKKLPSPPSRNGLYRLLPASLLSIDITFDYDHCLLYNGDQGWKVFHNRGEDVDEERYAWLVELVVHKADATPKLMRIRMRENWKFGCRTKQAQFPWRTPQKLRDLLEEKGIESDIWMRRPSDWKKRVSDGA